jgi:sugar lactone lactonase YvrE
MMSSLNWSICTLSFALIACHSNPPDTPPADASPPIDTIPPIDAPTGPVELVLLAGDIGGPGNLDGVGAAARFGSPAGVAIDSAGNIYVAEGRSNTIRKITAAGIVTTLAGATGVDGYTDGTGTAARFHFPGDVAADNAGNVYVADTYNHTIRKITAAGEVTTLAGQADNDGSTDGTGTAAMFAYPGGVAVDSAGNIYVADTYTSTIRTITATGVVTTLAGAARMPGYRDDTGAAARFDHPGDVAVDSAGNVYVADTYNHLIRKITPAGEVTTLAGAAGSPGSMNGTGTAAHFNNPSGVAVDSAGNVYVTEVWSNTIRKITPAGEVTTLAGAVVETGSTDGTGTAARFYNPSDVAVDGAGNVYVADLGNYVIRKITPSAEVTTLAGAPLLREESTDGTGAAARFYLPNGVAADRSGNIYVADTVNHTIRKVTPAGVVTTLAGKPGSTGSTDGAGNTARFNFPRGAAVDHAGNIYVADTENHTIRKVTPAGVVTTLAGTAGMTGITDGTGTAARFNRPNGVAVDSAGNVYVADTGNHTIRKITPAGEVTTLAGTAGVSGSLNSTIALTARFYEPTGVAVDSAGNVYVADKYNHTIRKIDASYGDVTALAGPTSIWFSGSTDGTGDAARFSQPSGVAVDSADNVYVADQFNSAIRKVTTPAGVTTTIAGKSGMAGISLGTTPRLAYPVALAITGDSIAIIDTGAVLLFRHGAR